MTTEAGLVAGKTFQCFRDDPETTAVPNLQEPESVRLAVTLEAEGLDPHTEEFPLDADVVQELMKILGGAE